jgi:opacity protein-like surface antigen
MKLIKLAALTLIGCSSVATLQAQIAGLPYFAIDAGVAFQQDVEIKSISTLPGYDGGAELVFDPGVRVDLIGGWNFTEDCSAELELGILYNEIDELVDDTGSFPFSSTDTEFALYQFPIMVNGIYRFPVSCPVKPYIGLGVGGIVHVEKVRFGGDDDYEEDITFGYQGQAGLRWDFAEGAALTLGYKFLGSTDPDFNGFEIDGPMSHSILAGINVSF